jgi:hypothetical protein
VAGFNCAAPAGSLRSLHRILPQLFRGGGNFLSKVPIDGFLAGVVATLAAAMRIRAAND